ncbi:hypothetical protein OPT61_g6423 [Boeremia exigua]|uniref:Uncharacterized protein n=1 Tax=Boeremia exigua TaxID=749465 RepID=A0ACC2I6P0_9PLEO|nr:hypothetical protein OPT61_g6423 [Boeremia exigua]
MARPNESMEEQELTEIPTESATTGLLDPGIPRLKRVQPLHEPNSRVRDFSKHVGLQLPDYVTGRAFSWRSPKEYPKVAIYRSRRMVTLNSLLHIVPVSGAIILLVLFWTQYWIGGNSDNGTSLQFAAKLHELLMQASLIDILWHVIRFQAISGYIPLGALSGAAKAHQLSYLWSLDFISAILSPDFVVGPSSAVLMIPRPDMSHTNSTVIRYFNVAESSLFPVQINSYTAGALNISDELSSYSYVDTDTDDGLPATGASWNYDNNRYFSAEHVVRVAYASFDSNSTVETSIATIPTILSTLQLVANSRFIGEHGFDSPYIASAKPANARWTSYTSQPFVMVKCSDTQSKKHAENAYYIRNNGSQSPLHDTANLLEPYLSKYANRTNAIVPPLWLTSPDSSKNLLMVILGPQEASWLLICTIAAFWHKTSTTMVLLNFDATIYTKPLESGEYLGKSSITEIIIDADFVSSLGLPCMESNTRATGHLALCFAAALSWIPASVQLVNGSSGINFEVYNQSELNESSRLSTFEFIETIDGYGYGATDTPIYLSVAVMLTYCIITTDSATELIMLALQSKEPAGLEHISVGLDSMETFRKGVGIRVSTLANDSTGQLVEKLELVFKDDEEARKRGLLKIELGKAY